MSERGNVQTTHFSYLKSEDDLGLVFRHLNDNNDYHFVSQPTMFSMVVNLLDYKVHTIIILITTTILIILTTILR